MYSGSGIQLIRLIGIYYLQPSVNSYFEDSHTDVVAEIAQLSRARDYNGGDDIDVKTVWIHMLLTEDKKMSGQKSGSYTVGLISRW